MVEGIDLRRDLQEAAAFPLMRLPSEIRLLVLEKLLQYVKYELDFGYHFEDSPKDDDGYWDEGQPCDCPLELDERLSVKLQISIFHTCGLLRHEALTVLQRKTCLFLEFPRKDPKLPVHEFTNYVHPLLVQNVSRIRVDGGLIELKFKRLLETLPRLDTVLSIMDEGVGICCFPLCNPVPNISIHEQKAKEHSPEAYERIVHYWPAPAFHCIFERGAAPKDPAKGFKFSLLTRPGNLQRPLRFLLGAEFVMDWDTRFVSHLSPTLRSLIVLAY